MDSKGNSMDAQPLRVLLEKQDEAGFVERLVAEELSDGREVCPRCGCGLVVRGTMAGDRYGVCMACYERAKASASHEYLRTIREFRESGRMRKACFDERKKLGIGAKEIERPEITFD